MIKPQNHILISALLLMSGSAFAQKHVPTDKEIIDLYCDGNAAEKGRYVNINGKTNLECDKGSPRYFFERANAKLGISNKKALKEKAYNYDPAQWSRLTAEYLLEQSKTCTKLEFINELPVFRCTPEDIKFTNQFFDSFKRSYEGFYNKGSVSFENDPNQTELVTILMSKDSKDGEVAPTGARLNTKDYFILPDLTTSFPGFEEIKRNGFNPSAFKTRFWTNDGVVNTGITPLSYKTNNPILAAEKGLRFLPQLTNNSAFYLGRAIAASSPRPTEPAPEPAAEVPTEPNNVVTPIETKPEEVKPVEPVSPVVEVAPKVESSCKDQLTQALSKLLQDDKQNIIGHQFELTVLRMAAFAVGHNKKSMEDYIRTKSSYIAKMDNGIIDHMNQVYKQYGLKSDAEKITKHLKQKAVNASYFPRDKRFFNEDSSAFVLALQKMIPNSGLKDTDVSVLWFMDKINKETRKTKGRYSAAANITNLSTRIAQYTGLTGAKKAYNSDELKALAANQQKELNAELNSFIDSFKEANAECYKELFTDSKADCDLSVVEGSLAQILAVQSQIPSADLVNIEGQEGLDKSRFQILKFANEN